MSGNKIKAAMGSILLLLIALLYNYPLLILAFNSLKSDSDYLTNPYGLPNPVVLSNLKTAYDSINFPVSAFNTLLITVIVVMALIIFSSMTAYAIVKRSSKFTRSIYILMISGLLIPFQVYMIPLVKVFQQMGILRTSLSLVLSIVASGTPLSVFLFSGYLKSISKEIEEAARIDGCGPYRLFFRIIFPIMQPCVAMIVIFFGLSTWNSFIQPLVLLGTGSFSMLFVEISKLMSRPYLQKWNLNFAACLLAMLPLIMMYVIMQEKIISGLTSGSVKG